MSEQSYKVGIVGESNYQPAIRGCAVGERVDVVHEIGNPYDEDALAIVAPSGEVIGYIAKSEWLRRAIVKEGKGCAATIAGIEAGDDGSLGVVLDVVLDAERLGSRSFGQAASPAGSSGGTGLIDMIGRWFRG